MWYQGTMPRPDALTRGRDAFARNDWQEANAQLSIAAEVSPMEPRDLMSLATAAYLVGEEEAATRCWRRAHLELINRGELEAAARCGFWLSFSLLLGGAAAQSRGWLSRTQKLIDDHGLDCVERGYLAVLLGLMLLGKGDNGAAGEAFQEAATLADRFGDVDLGALGALSRGQALIAEGDTTEGVALLDQAMIAVIGGEVSPVLAGTIYCAVILTCQRIYDLHRAREWTNALNAWCARQPQLVAFRGRCRVHRSEILQRQGEWSEALEEAKRASEQLSDPPQKSAGHAFYQRGEIHRMRGDFELAEKMYREAARIGREPQPGVALLRMAQGDLESASAAMRRVVDEAKPGHGLTGGAPRAQVLGPYVEIMLATDDLRSARAAADELAEIANGTRADLLSALSAEATGAVLLKENDPKAALAALRCAWTYWQRLEAPYESARVRVLIALSCRDLGDTDTAEMHLEAARAVFARLSAAPDLARIEEEMGSKRAHAGHDGLTGRELEVLALVASGKTNRRIASELHISEHTVARHLSNIFRKIGVSSRTAASTFALQHGLL